jgi:TIR domain
VNRRFEIGGTWGHQMAPATSADVFISFSRQDMGEADKICQALESASVRGWVVHRDIAPGADSLSSILEAADGCRAVVVILSANTSTSNIYVLERAEKRGIPIISVILDDATPAEFSRFKKSKLGIDASARRFESHLPLLVARASSVLSPSRPATSPGVSDISNSVVLGSQNRLAAADSQPSAVDEKAIEVALQTLDRVFSEMNRGARDPAE